MIAPKPIKQPWPLNHITEPRPEEWGIGMTCCVGVFSKADGTIALVSDLMISTGDVGGDSLTLKLEQVGHKWAAMFAGNDISPVVPIIEDVRSRLQGYDEIPLRDMVEAFTKAYATQLQRKIEKEILARLGFENLTEFRTEGLKDLGQEIFAQVLEKTRKVGLDLQFLVSGFCEKKRPHIFTVNNPGIEEYYDKLGFWVIGSGQTNALGSLFAARIRHSTPITEIIYRACEAKFMAESAPGVGENTLAAVLRPLGGHRVLLVEEKDQLKKIWRANLRIEPPKEAMESTKRILSKTYEEAENEILKTTEKAKPRLVPGQQNKK
jgi:hypothetical protein